MRKNKFISFNKYKEQNPRHVDEDGSATAAQAKVDANLKMSEIKRKRQEAAKDGDDFTVQMMDIDLKMAQLDLQKSDLAAQKSHLGQAKKIADKNKSRGEKRKEE